MGHGQSSELFGPRSGVFNREPSRGAALILRALGRETTPMGLPKVVYFARHGRSPGTLVPIAGTHVRPDRTQQEIAPRATMAKEGFVRWFMRLDCGPLR